MNKVQIGEFIRENRKVQGLSQLQLATKAQLNRRQQLIEMENAQSDYGIDVLIKVLNALGMSIGTTALYTPKGFDFSQIESATEEVVKLKKKK